MSLVSVSILCVNSLIARRMYEEVVDAFGRAARDPVSEDDVSALRAALSLSREEGAPAEREGEPAARAEGPAAPVGYEK